MLAVCSWVADTVLTGILFDPFVEVAVPLHVYRRSRPSASGLDPEGEGRKPR